MNTFQTKVIQKGDYYERIKAQKERFLPFKEEFVERVRGGEHMKDLSHDLGVPMFVVREWASEMVRSKRLVIPEKLVEILPDIRVIPSFQQERIVKLFESGTVTDEVLRVEFESALRGRWG